MPVTHKVVLHTNGPALWPEHKPLDEVLELKRSTLESVWSATYQGSATPPGGVVFLRDWWRGAGRRFDAADPVASRRCIGRWISLDTALKEKQENDYSAWCVAELWRDYRLAIIAAGHERLGLPALHNQIEALMRQYNYDGKLKGVIIEDKGSGTSVIQTLKAASEPWIGPLLIPFLPHGEKLVRWKQASIWCQNGSVMLPIPGETVPWLIDLEDELFLAPAAPNDDLLDSLTQLLIYLEHVLARGDAARHGKTAQAPSAPPPQSRVEQAMQNAR